LGGEVAASGSPVNLLVTSASANVIVPSVVGLTQSAATSTITGAGLTLGTVTLQASATTPAGSVISQAPVAGSSVASGTAVAIVVSSGTSAAPTLASVVSRRVHGAAGTFDLLLGSVATNPTTEPRQGPAFTLVFTFNKAVTAGTAQVSAGTATAGVPTFNGSEMIVPLTGVTNQQYVTVAVSSVTAADGGSGGSGSIRVGLLLGDVSQNRVVTLSDLGQVNAQVAQFVTATNYLKDVNASGTLSLADKGITNTQITKALPAP
jgi:hypothetical protein